MEIETTTVAFTVRHCAAAPRRPQTFYEIYINNTHLL